MPDLEECRAALAAAQSKRMTWLMRMLLLGVIAGLCFIGLSYLLVVMPEQEALRYASFAGFALAGVGTVVSMIATSTAGGHLYKAQKALDYATRWHGFYEKYGDVAVANNIMAHQVWQGATMAMMRDSWGAPVARDEKVMKTKTKTTWKYQQTGRGRYAVRVTFENGVVVGWEKKGG